MTQQDINIFLALVEKRNLSKAASALYMSQSTLSHRLNMLEKELNATLFTRQKGHRTLELTPFGHDFIHIAERWTALWAETQELHTMHGSRSFYVGSVPSLIQYLFPELLQKIFQKNSGQIRLMIKSMQSAALYPALENRELDLGFSVLPSVYSNVINKPLLTEENVVVLSSSSPTAPGTFGEPVRPGDLNAEKELLFQYSQTYIHWRNQWFGYFSSPAIGMGDGPLVKQFYQTPNDLWCVVPMSLALFLQSSCNVSLHRLTSPPPPRTCYMLTHRIPRTGYESCLQLFEESLYEYLRQKEAAGHLQLLI